MSGLAVLAVIAIAQGIFFVALVTSIAGRRLRARVSAILEEPRREAARAALLRWATGTEPVGPLVKALRQLPRESALDFTCDAAATTLAADARAELGAALRDEPWVEETLAMGRARGWWHRRQAARILAVVGGPSDRDTLARLLRDPEPAVAVIAGTALPAVGDLALVGDALDRYPELPTVVRRFLVSSFEQMRTLVEPALVERIGAGGDPRRLARWINLAADLRLGTAIERAAVMTGHADARVRRAVARALGRRPSASSVQALRTMLADAAPDVRTAAARALGELGRRDAVTDLLRAARDPVWAVRYGAVIALAQLGEGGRTAIHELREDPDRYIADIATIVSGLSDGALLELVES